VSDDDKPLSKFQQRLAERRAKEAAEKASEEDYSDLVPENPYSPSESDRALDAAIKRIDILDAYRRYIGKNNPTVRKGQREGIEISCPAPGHVDKEPSAWVNLDKQTWNCGRCKIGGDALDFAAIAKGLAWPNTYKKDGSFRRLKERMAEDFGFKVTSLPGGAAVVTEPETDKLDTPDNSDKSDISDKPTASSDKKSADSSDGEIIELFEEDENFLIPGFDWKKIIEPNTFLHAYMKAAKVDDAPLEYHLFHALIGLGMALGRDVRLFDSQPVYGNLFVCTIGRSGSGKSKAKTYLDTLLNKALPHKWDDPFSKGTLHVNAPGSAEVLIHSFQKPILDPADAKKVIAYSPVRGLISFSELSSLTGRTGRQGSVLNPTLMQFYDMERKVSTRSLTHGIKEADFPFASAITSTQPKALKDLLSKSDDASGFLNRWVYVLGKPKKKFAVGGAVVDMDPAVPYLERVFGWAGGFRHDEMISWSDKALARFENFFYQRIERDKERTDHDLLVRIDLVLKKLILLFTANLMLKEVPVKCVDAAIEMYEYLVTGFSVPASQIIRTPTGDMQEAIMNLALKQYKLDGKGVTLRQISKSLWRRNYSAEQLNRTVDALVKIGMLNMVTSPVGVRGAPTVRYKYVN
jgi:hypothetical protein